MKCYMLHVLYIHGICSTIDPCFWLNKHQSSIILPLANGRTLHASPLATGRQRYFPSMPWPFGARIRWRFYGIDGPLKGVIYIYICIGDLPIQTTTTRRRRRKKTNKQKTRIIRRTTTKVIVQFASCYITKGYTLKQVTWKP